MILHFGLPHSLTAGHNDLFQRLKLDVGLISDQDRSYNGKIELDLHKFNRVMDALAHFTRYKGVYLYDLVRLSNMRQDLETALVNVNKVLENADVLSASRSLTRDSTRDTRAAAGSSGLGAASCCFAFDSGGVATD